MSVFAIILKLLKSQIKIDSTTLLTLEYCPQTRSTIFLVEVSFYAAVMWGLNIANVVGMCFKSPVQGFSFAASGLVYSWDSLCLTLSVGCLVCLSTSVTNEATG